MVQPTFHPFWPRAEARQDAVADTVHTAVGAQVFQAAAAGVVHLPWGPLDRHGIGLYARATVWVII